MARAVDRVVLARVILAVLEHGPGSTAPGIRAMHPDEVHTGVTRRDGYCALSESARSTITRSDGDEQS